MKSNNHPNTFDHHLNRSSKKRVLHESWDVSKDDNDEDTKTNNNSNSILRIPLSDFPSLDNNKKLRKDDDDDGPEEKKDELLLLQLPPSLSIQQLLSSSSKEKKNNNDDTTTSSQLVISSSSEDPKCRLVTEDQSFDLIRVETSNSYVLVPPSSTTEDWKGCRLLRETNTYFLECQATPPLLDLYQLEQMMGKRRWSIKELAHQLGSSIGQVQTSLQQLVKDHHHIQFHLSSGEIEMIPKEHIPYQAIIDTLMEWDGASATTLSIPDMLPQILQRLSPPHPPNVHSILTNTLRLLSTNPYDTSNQPPHITIDPQKVARVVARLILEQQPKWDSMEDFVTVWQQRMPGDVVDIPKEDWAQGLLFNLEYFPETSLSLQLETRIQQLFQHQHQWTLEQLQPYLSRFVVPDAGNSIVELLLPHTISTKDDTTTQQQQQQQQQTIYTLPPTP